MKKYFKNPKRLFIILGILAIPFIITITGDEGVIALGIWHLPETGPINTIYWYTSIVNLILLIPAYFVDMSISYLFIAAGATNSTLGTQVFPLFALLNLFFYAVLINYFVNKRRTKSLEGIKDEIIKN